jgi:hypothetical protein
LSRNFEDFSYTFVAEHAPFTDPALAGVSLYEIEMRPKDETAPYSRVLAWIGMEDYATRALECYGRADGALAKTIVFARMEKVQGMIVPVVTVVASRKRGSATRLELSGLRVNSGLDEGIFSLKNLER